MRNLRYLSAFFFLTLVIVTVVGLTAGQDPPTPRSTSAPSPDIPPEAKGLALTVVVTLQATVDQSGRVSAAQVTGTRIDFCGRATQIEAALEAWRREALAALRQWQFEPQANAPVVLYVQFKNGSFNGDAVLSGLLNRAGIARVESTISSKEPTRGVDAPCPPAQQNFTADVRSGYSLTSDGVGSYVHGNQGVAAIAQYAITFCTDPRSCTTLPEGQPVTASQRAVLLDLSAPIASSGAKSLGAVRASAANFGAFWGQDTTRRAIYNGREGPVIRSVLDITVGSTIESERVEIRFFVDNTQYLLQFGPWPAGQYQASQGALHGEGTTRATITRVSEGTWRVRSGADSIGRLWNNRDATRPVDLGLFRFSYDVQFDRQ